MAGQLDVIVATNAFGMGVDKSDIRLVVHADIPRSPEAYYQEAGRGGRDGKPTRCVLLFNHGDIRLQEFLIDASYPSAELLRGLWKLLRDQPELGKLTRDDDELEARLKPHLPGDRRRERGDRRRRSASSSATACSRATTSGSRPRARRPGSLPAARRRVAAAPRRCRARQAAHDGRATRTTRGAAASTCSSTSATRTGRSRERRCGACDNCEAVAHGKPTGPLRPTRSRRCAALLHARRRAATAGSAARGSPRSRTAPTTTRASTSCPSAAACAAGRRSTCSICCARSRAPASSRRRAASTRRSRPRARRSGRDRPARSERPRHPDADRHQARAQAALSGETAGDLGDRKPNQRRGTSRSQVMSSPSACATGAERVRSHRRAEIAEP